MAEVMTYLILKYMHILSMVLLFGIGLGSAFYKWMADRSHNLEHIAVTNRNVVIADWLYARMWFLLGVPAFISMVVVVFLMICKSV